MVYSYIYICNEVLNESELTPSKNKAIQGALVGRGFPYSEVPEFEAELRDYCNIQPTRDTLRINWQFNAFLL